MTKSIATKSLSALLIAGIAVSGLASAASAEPREPVLVAAPQVGVATIAFRPSESVTVRWE